MCTENLCGTHFTDQQAGCGKLAVNSVQQSILLTPVSNIDMGTTVFKDDLTSADCQNHVADFKLIDSDLTAMLKLPSRASVIDLAFSGSVTDYGTPQYQHKAPILLEGSDAEAMCMLRTMHREKLAAVIALNGTSEDKYWLIGGRNGMVLSDFDFALAEGGGYIELELATLEDELEGGVPLALEVGGIFTDLAALDAAFCAKFPN